MTRKQRIVLLSIETFFFALNLGIYFTQKDPVYQTVGLIFAVTFALFFIVDWHALQRKEDE
jgi:hypothetical protein